MNCRSLHCGVVSLDKKLCSIVFLQSGVFIIGYQRHSAGCNPVMDQHPIRGE